jgi:hypothetical protein
MTFEKGMARLTTIRKRVRWIADEEGRFAPARSGLEKELFLRPERARLIEEAKAILEGLEGEDA